MYDLFVLCFANSKNRIGIDFLRRGAFTSMVLVELIWVFVLWVLWIAAAALAAQEQQNVFGEGNSCNYINSESCAGLARKSRTKCSYFVQLTWLLRATSSVLSRRSAS